MSTNKNKRCSDELTQLAHTLAQRIARFLERQRLLEGNAEHMMIAVLIGLVLYIAEKDWRTDLVESRRRFRTGFFVAWGSLALVISFSNFFQLGTPRSNTGETISQGILLLVMAIVFVRYLEFRSGYPTDPKRPVFASLPPVDQSVEVLEMLERLMGEDQFYQEEGITIGRLAVKVGQPEHRLRRLINGNFGYRNFNQFLSKYRIEEAARQLTSADTRHLPVLSIALEVGYRALAPFNKAFKERHGMTPTEYRSRNIIS